ncbi:hypothetical protein BaRGS_00018162 [Batillaria attramentaria]|uniref:Uncharacterized protein n=1 Tax=Batillaria attramentaria TaxID=370345 RepID=A0ABD0KTQ3_9CAEN
MWGKCKHVYGRWNPNGRSAQSIASEGEERARARLRSRAQFAEEFPLNILGKSMVAMATGSRGDGFPFDKALVGGFVAQCRGRGVRGGKAEGGHRWRDDHCQGRQGVGGA